MSADLDSLLNQLELSLLGKTATATLTADIATQQPLLDELESDLSALDSRLRNLEQSDWWLTTQTQYLLSCKEDSSNLTVRSTQSQCDLVELESDTTALRSRLDVIEDGMLNLIDP